MHFRILRNPLLKDKCTLYFLEIPKTVSILFFFKTVNYKPRNRLINWTNPFFIWFLGFMVM